MPRFGSDYNSVNSSTLNESLAVLNTVDGKAIKISIDPKMSTDKFEISMDEEQVWERIFNEYEGNERKKGLWTKIYVDLNGDEDKVKIAYFRERYKQIIDENRNSKSSDLIGNKIPDENIGDLSVKNLPPNQKLQRSMASLADTHENIKYLEIQGYQVQVTRFSGKSPKTFTVSKNGVNYLFDLDFDQERFAKFIGRL
jgi:hypothetical protein